MSPEVLYSMLIGVLVSLLFSAIFGIFKLIVFAADKLAKKKVKQEEPSQAEEVPQEVQKKESDMPKKRLGIKMKKRTIIIALCVVLGIAIIASSVALIPTIGSKHTITFYYNRGIYFYTTYSGEERMVANRQDTYVYKEEEFSGRYPSEPEPPSNKGYVFLGWYKNPECTDEFVFGQDVVNCDINLYAKWRKIN